MKKFRIETQMTLLAVVMVAAVVVSGYFVYQSLSRIAGLVHSEARPDLLLTQIRDVTSDLSEVENQARLYILTRDQENLQAFQSLYNSVENKIQALDPRGAKDYYGAGALDSVRSLVLERLVVWEEVLQLHTSAEDPRERLSEISARLESASPDTVVAEPEK
ncbi:MAG TPA: CHASE3 domain-containing protein, partial [Prolixibacteraceae bacterium]|nr:CHASE3 domain-containing protein [Prolixibacteraceae bacterium]